MVVCDLSQELVDLGHDQIERLLGQEPAMALRLSVADRARSGTTGKLVSRVASLGSSRSRTASSTTVIWSMAFTPRKGILPWAVRPVVTRSNQ